MTSWHYDFNAKKKMASYKLSLNDQMLKSLVNIDKYYNSCNFQLLNYI